MKNLIKKLSTAALALTMLGGNAQLPINPIVEKVYATETEYNEKESNLNNNSRDSENTSNQQDTQILLDSLKYAYSFCEEAGGNITYIDSSTGDHRNAGKLEDGYSDCSHFVHRVFEHTGVMKEFVRSKDWGFNGCPGTSVVAEFKGKEKIDLSNASPRRYILVAWWKWKK